MSAGANHDPLNVRAARHRLQPFRPCCTMPMGSCTHVIAHQIHRACGDLRCAAALRKQVRKLRTAEQWRDVHSQIDRPSCVQPGIGHIGPTGPLGFQNSFMANLLVRTGDGCKVDAQCLGQFALRGQAVARPKNAVLHRCNDLRGDLLVPRA
ncbi:hypothetical protein D3C72_1729920 [compost metagenome]